MKVTLLAVVTLTAVATFAGAADPECVYRKLRGLSPHWPNPSNCSSYYRCSTKNTVRPINCPSGKEYNPKTGKCSTAGRGLCKLSLAAPLTEVANVCANEVNGAYLPKTSYCSEFYICNEQLAYPQICDAGSLFDIQTNACVVDTYTECWQNKCLNEADGVFLPSSTSCADYYSCKDKVATLETCASSTYFDATVSACVVDEDNSQCWENFCIGKPDGSMVADADNCVNFYICFNQKATMQNCPTGSYFELSGLHCVPGTCPEPDCSTTTTVAPPADCDCPDGSQQGDMVADPENCRKYFTCYNGELVAGDCQLGNYFDDNLKVCAADTSNCCPESSTSDCTEGEMAVNPQDCNQYYSCEDNIWESKTCPSGSYFDEVILTCVIDVDNKCPQCNTVSDSDASSTLATNPTETVMDVAVVAGGVCREIDAAVGADNCWSYFACISGSWKQESCIGGFFFDSSVGICRRDDNNVCPENKLMQANSRSRRDVDSDCTCPNNMTEGSMAVHPTQCDMYVICVNGELVEGTCGQGNIFSSCDNVCVPDTEATCWVCSNKPNGYLLIDPQDCTSYLTCSNGLAVNASCGTGEWFDGTGCIIDVTGQCINPCTCGTGNVAHPICSKYFQCTDGVPQVVDCAAGEGFDATTGKCSSKVTCTANLCATADDGTIFPVTGDPSRFYICLNNLAEIRSCPANSALDATFLICLAQPSSSCDQTQCKKTTLNLVYPSLDSDNSTYCLCESDGAYLNNCESGYTFNATLGLCTFTGPCDPQACVDQTEYSVSINYDDPNSFCLCRANEPVPVTCPIGYTFNAEILLCVLAPQPDPRCCRSYCVGKPNGDTFPALDTDTGFCLCLDEVPSYNNCPLGKTYDATLGICLDTVDDTPCECNECNSATCAEAEPNLVFPSESATAGFCYCKDVCAVYTLCPEGKEFDPELLICLETGPENCNATLCDSLAENQAYEANNGTAGFCYCEGGLPNYSLCPEGKEFDVELAICLEPLDGCANAYCDSEKCSCLVDYDTFPSSNTEDDTSFCYCSGGEAFYDNCPNGKVYDVTEGICLIREAPCSVCGVGGCAALADNSNFAALNTTSGFCLCTEGVAIYESCPAGKEYDTTYGICLEPVAAASQELTCDPAQCNSRTAATTFAAQDNDTGFCTCDAQGVATFQSCGEYHIFDNLLSVCVVDACDAAVCRSRAKFDAFAARNTTKGFCSCDIIPTYYHCTAGHAFDETLGVCVDEVTATVAACDPRECLQHVQFEAFAAKNTTEGFCSCDGAAEIVTYHKCTDGKVFDRALALCLMDEHVIQKRSVESLEKFACEANKKRSVPANCSQFEICLEGNWRRRTCAEERYYNPEQQLCLEPRDDLVCSYARVLGLPACDASSEALTIPSPASKGSCLQYFRCAAGKWRLRSCPKRHYFAGSLGTCLAMPDFQGEDFCGWLNRSESRVQAECQQLTVRPYPLGCDKFLMCMENAWWIQQCPLGMYFSQLANYCLPNDANQCRLDSATACVHGQKRALATSCRGYEQCVNSQWLVKSCGPLEQFEPLLGCVTNDGSCQGSGLRRSCQPGELRALPLPEANCTQFFYYCEADEWHLGSCLRGQSFAGQLNRCQSLDSCQAQLKSLAASSCAGQPDGRSVAHADDCTRFYLCLQEQPALLQSCAVGSFFDATRGYCRPNDGSCRQMDSVCSNHTDGGFVAHAENCRAYYNCSSQTSGQLLYCPQGQYFNKLLAQCRLDQGQCQPQSHSDSSLGLCTDVEHGTRLPHRLYCNLYYACVHGLPILAECAPQMSFSAVLGRCELESEQESNCQLGQLDKSGNSSAIYSCDNLQDGSYVPDLRDCTRYFICAGGVALTQRCGPGGYFDAEQLLCTQDDGSCPYVLQNVTEVVPSSDHEPPSPILCEGKHGHLLPDLANCNNFYICVSSKLRCERCYEGYFFNATLQQCQSLELSTDEDQDVHVVTRAEALDSDPAEPPELPKCSDAPTDFASLCSTLIVEGASIAEPGDCRRYISCDELEPVSQRCRNGESYDSLLGICRQNDGTCLMENGERVGVCNGRHGQLARDVHNCRGYFVCLHGQKIEAECDAGQFFSKATNTCELDVLQQCSSNSNETAKLEE